MSVNHKSRFFRTVSVVLAAVMLWAVMTTFAVLAKESASALPYVEEKLEFKASNGQKLTYLLAKPKNFNKNSRYPLVVFLHGVGGDSDITGYEALRRQLFSRGLDCVFLAPLADWNGGQTWIDYQGVLAKVPPYVNYDQKKFSITPALFAAKELIEKTKVSCHTDPDRSYILGVSMGGYGTWDLITRYPDLMTAAVPICGGNDPKTASKVKDMPIWMFHGTKDEAVAVDCAQKMFAALQNAGSGKVKYTQYEGLDHGIWFKVFEEPEMLPWLFAQGTGVEDSFADLSKTSSHRNVSVQTGKKFGSATRNCLIRGDGDGAISYAAKSGETIADVRLNLTLMADDVAYFLKQNGHQSINDLIRLEVQTKGSKAWKAVPMKESKPALLGKTSGRAEDYSSLWLTPEKALGADVTAVRYVFDGSYPNWYMMASKAEMLYKPKERRVDWVDPLPERVDHWDGVTMTEGWDGVDDFSGLTHVVDSDNMQAFNDGFIQQTVLAKKGHGPAGYVRYAQKDCYITDLKLNASLIEGFLPPMLSEWLTVSVRTEGSKQDIPIAMTKTEGVLLYQNQSNEDYNYYSSVITPKRPLPDRVVSVRIGFGRRFINYTIYLDQAVLTFAPAEPRPEAGSVPTVEDVSEPGSEAASEEDGSEEEPFSDSSEEGSEGGSVSASQTGPQGGESSPEQQKSAGWIWIPIAIVLVLAAVGVTVWLVLRRKKNAQK